MAIPHNTKLYGISDMRIAKMLTDPPGGAASYSASIDVIGVTKMLLSRAVATTQLRGDTTLPDIDSTVNGVSAVIDYAKWNSDAMNILMGGAVSDTGVTPNQVSTFRLLGGAPPLAPSLPNFFKIEAKAVAVDYINCDCHIALGKVKIDAFPLFGFNEEDYQLFNFGVQRAPRAADGFWADVVYNDTLAALASKG